MYQTGLTTTTAVIVIVIVVVIVIVIGPVIVAVHVNGNGPLGVIDTVITVVRMRGLRDGAREMCSEPIRES
jgi:hypothetical protein